MIRARLRIEKEKRMKRTRSIFKKLTVLVMAVMLVCAFAVSCGGNQPAPRTIDGNVEYNAEKDGVGQQSLNEIANFLLNNADAYAGIVAAYRGYNVLDSTLDVKTGETYEELYEKDENGSFKLDENGEKIRFINVDAAKAVLTKYDTKVELNHEKLDAEDIENLVKKLQIAVTFETERGLFDNIMYGIGVALGWITRTIGFGNYIVGICIFAIILELLMLPLGIKRQKNSIKQAKLRPKEMAIRKKYAGRNDQATQQKVQAEIQEMYQKENFNPASGCLPLLLQLPILLVLYNIVIDPLKHVLGIAGNMSSAMQLYYSTSPLAGGYGGVLSQQGSTGSIEALSKIGDVAVEAFEGIKNFAYFTNGSDVYGKLAEIHSDIPSFNIGNVNFGLIPSFKDFGWLLLVPVLTFIVYFASSKLTRKFMYQPTTADNQQMGCSNNVMDIMMPAISVYFTFMVPAAIGVYWMFKSVLSTVQQFILTKIMPLPQFTDEDYKAAEREITGKAPKNTPRAPRDPNAPRSRSLHHIDDEDYDENGVYKPVEKEEKAEAPEKKLGVSLPEGAAPLKEDAPDHGKKKQKDAAKAEETEADKDSTAEENK